jgi:hypothetical protein
LIESTAHKLHIGDTIQLNGFTIKPESKTSGIYTVTNVIDVDHFTINYFTYFVDASNNFYETSIQTGYFTVNFPDHKFNTINLIQNGVDPDTVDITFNFKHGFTNFADISVTSTNSVPVIDGYHENAVIVDDYTVTISFVGGITTNGSYGILGQSLAFYLYGIQDFAGILGDQINGNQYTVREIVDVDTFTFYSNQVFVKEATSGGGDSVRINSKVHGWNGIQENTIKGTLIRNISLQGFDFVFIKSDLLGSTLFNSKNIPAFSEILLTESPGFLLTNSHITVPTIFEKPIPEVSFIDLSVWNPNNTKYEFMDLDWSAHFLFKEYIYNTSPTFSAITGQPTQQN